MKKRKLSVFQITVMALMAAVTCILAPNTIQIGIIPITFTNLVIYFSVYILGTGFGLGSYLIYLLMGIVGLPVFSEYEGGFQKLVGPTGGYLMGFIVMILVAGIMMERSHRNLTFTIIGWVIGTVLAYIMGTVWFVHLTGMGYSKALKLCVYPFIVMDIVKIVLGTFLGKNVYTALKRAGLIQQLEKKQCDNEQKMCG